MNTVCGGKPVPSGFQQFVPPSTRDGVDALRKILERNRELYRYEETEIGDFEGILGDYLKGNINFGQVIQQAHSRARPQTQTLGGEDLLSAENVTCPICSNLMIRKIKTTLETAGVVRDSVFTRA